MSSNSSKPIGIFDSGIGGLTVASAIRRVLPKERLVYFGDTAHLPYGDKSEAAIQSYSVRITDFLLKKGCKIIVVACNSASSSAFDLLQEYTGSKATVINVIDPMVEYINEHYLNQNVGLIGTKRTTMSKVYNEKIEKLERGIHFYSMATPLLVPMIEEGFFNNRISHDIIDKYLNNEEFTHLDALILGCTHYPLIKDEIGSFLGNQTDVLDSSEITAQFLRKFLEQNNLLSNRLTSSNKFFVSDFTQSFEASTRIFFGQKINLQLRNLWE